MVDYKESQVAGSQWTRCFQLVISNRVGITPTVTLSEEDIIQLGSGESFARVRGHIEASFNNPETSFPLLDPVTSEPLGASMTHGELYVALRSLYLELARLRDEEV